MNEDRQQEPRKGQGSEGEEQVKKVEGKGDESGKDDGGKKCPECGEPIEDVRATCPNCGYEYKDEDYTDPEAGKEFIAGAAVDEEGQERPEQMDEIEDRIAAEEGSGEEESETAGERRETSE
jgi:hypothetical protein